MAPQPGDIYYDPHFRFPDGAMKGKLFIILGLAPSDDYIVARTTSNPQRKSWHYGCHNDEPDPNFFIPIGRQVFHKDTWINLDYLVDLDARDFKAKIKARDIQHKDRLPVDILKDLMACAASADDTTQLQEKVIRDTLTTLA